MNKLSCIIRLMTVKTLEKSLNWINFNTSSFYDVDFYVISKLNFIFNFQPQKRKLLLRRLSSMRPTSGGQWMRTKWPMTNWLKGFVNLRLMLSLSKIWSRKDSVKDVIAEMMYERSTCCVVRIWLCTVLLWRVLYRKFLKGLC